jgi:hypothetical protein
MFYYIIQLSLDVLVIDYDHYKIIVNQLTTRKALKGRTSTNG